jgi:hypothetical protein
MNELPHIDPKSIEENKKLDKTRQNSSRSRGGPYTKKQQIDRRNEVYRLYVEKGYSATYISNIIKVNRHTIDSDLSYWYAKLADDWNKQLSDFWYMKIINRFELQVSRLTKYLEDATTLEHKISIEKLLLETNSRIIDHINKIETNGLKITHLILERINELSKNHNLGFQLLDRHMIDKVSDETYDKVMEILDSNKKE